MYPMGINGISQKETNCVSLHAWDWPIICEVYLSMFDALETLFCLTGK